MQTNLAHNSQNTSDKLGEMEALTELEQMVAQWRIL